MKGGQESREITKSQSTINTRWILTKEQKDLSVEMYREGIRNPTPDQIDEIASQLWMYGTIQSKSVHHLFQNRKAGERR